jgi:hypothetical protein
MTKHEKRLRREIKKEYKEKYDELVEDLKSMPKKGINPLPYIFWYLRVKPFMSIVIMFILTICVILISSGFNIKTKYLDWNKDKVDVLEKIEKAKGK